MFKRPIRLARAAHKTGEMNQYERAYAKVLDDRLKAGEIAAYAFERYKLRLSTNCFYTPDFMVVRADGVLEFHEVKGFWEEDARVKIKVAADMFPHVFVAVTRPKTKAQREKTPWLYEYFTKEDKNAPAPQPAPQPAHRCRECAFFTYTSTRCTCLKWGTYTQGFDSCCEQFRPKPKEQ